MKRLLKVQSELKAPKGRKNSFGNYNYRSAEDILEAVKPLLAEVGLVMVISDDVENIGERYYIKSTVKIFDAEDGHLVAENFAYARESLDKKGMSSEQLTGSCSSYCRKYCLNGMFLIDDTKDADTDEFAKQTKSKVPSLSTLKAKFDTELTDEQKEETLKHYKASKLADLNDDQKIELETALTRKAKKEKS